MYTFIISITVFLSNIPKFHVYGQDGFIILLFLPLLFCYFFFISSVRGSPYSSSLLFSFLHLRILLLHYFSEETKVALSVQMYNFLSIFFSLFFLAHRRRKVTSVSAYLTKMICHCFSFCCFFSYTLSSSLVHRPSPVQNRRRMRFLLLLPTFV